ncbi:hypothetical protein N7470_003674 [Penicillium chermesinum]|nr:hypothetical protein N7470_003674 [Penicillium chermesinum]
MPTLRSHTNRVLRTPEPCTLKVNKVVGTPSSSAANIAPAEILLEIFALLSPRDFDNARRTCPQWMRVGLNKRLLEIMLRRAGWWDAWRQDNARQKASSLLSHESEVWRMSKRFATECLLSGRKVGVEKPGFQIAAITDFSELSRGSHRKSRRYGSQGLCSTTPQSKASSAVKSFNVSGCGGYVIVTSGYMIYTYRLDDRRSKAISSTKSEDTGITLISSISCSSEVVSATLDTSTPRLVVAALLRNRVGMICDIGDYGDDRNDIQGCAPRPSSSSSSNGSPHYYYNVCSEDHPPQTMALCPGRRCVAFGCAAGIEIHWVDEATQKDQRRHFPMSQPSEVLHFLASSPESPDELRLISSMAGPGIPECACRQSSFSGHAKKCQFNFLGNNRSCNRKASLNRSSSLNLVRATHCHHYRAAPINDGYHMIFVEPRTGLLCIGSDAPIGGPASLTRAFVCIPPLQKGRCSPSKDAHTPTAFAVGSDLSWGLRVVAAYRDRIVLFSIPLDVFNVIRNERERLVNGVMGDSNLAHDWFLDSDHSRKHQESLAESQSGDWDFLLSVSYRATAMMWPFKVYGKEIGRVSNLVDLAIQTGNGGARIWTFDASGKATLFDIDTSAPQDTAAPFCKRVNIGPSGLIDSVSLMSLEEQHALSRPNRKRKFSQLQVDFTGRYGADRCRKSAPSVKGKRNSAGVRDDAASMRRPAFAACIVDFKITELGLRRGPWKSLGS